MSEPEPSSPKAPQPIAARRPAVSADDTTCPRCGESQQLAKVKGCIKCLTCDFKFDCNGW